MSKYSYGLYSLNEGVRGPTPTLVPSLEYNPERMYGKYKHKNIIRLSIFSDFIDTTVHNSYLPFAVGHF